MITGETITDEQIRELLVGDDLDLAHRIEGRALTPDEEIREWASIALYLEGDPRMYRAARARCAEILNARAKEES